MRHRSYMSLTGALLAIALVGLACVDKPGGGTTSGTVLYAYDSTSTAKQIIEWDADAFFTSESPTILKTVSSSVISDKIGQNLAWGGLCLDPTSNRIYLVNEATGDVVRVNNIRNQSGTISSTSPDVATFTLGSSSDRLSSGKFGQAALDTATGTLYVTEKNDSDTRIWVVSGASGIAGGTTVQPNLLKVSGDKNCSGVAAGLNGQVFAYFDSGNLIGADQISGPRLRKGSSSAFPFDAAVLVGSNTTLGKYGTLALDTGNNLLFVARHNTDASTTGAPVLAFSIGKLNGGGYNQAPDFTLKLGTAVDQSDLRVLAHPGTKEWLAALTSTGETANNKIHIWKLPRDLTSVVSTKVISNSLFKGIAFDGNN